MDKITLLKTGLDFMHYTGVARAFAAPCRGMGAIFMLHHIFPGAERPNIYGPNAALEISPDFLSDVIKFVRQRGYDLLSLDDAVERLKTGATHKRPFAVFTIDDGYLDNLEHALPVFQAHECPFTIFISSGIIEGTCEIWWRGLEAVIANSQHITMTEGPLQFDLATQTDQEKSDAFEELYWPVRTLPEHEQRTWIKGFCEQYGVNIHALCSAQAMTWDQVRKIAADPLCTLGAHTVNHYAVSRLEPQEVIEEAVKSADRVEEEIGKRPDLFAYPYGDETSAGPRDFELIREAGFKAAVTTRKGMIFPQHKDHLTALPRTSLNGHFQQLRYVDVFMSGTAFALWNGFNRVKTA